MAGAVKRPREETAPPLTDHKTAVSVVPKTVDLNCSVPSVTTDAERGEIDTETAALALPLKTEHAEKDRDKKNTASFTDMYFTGILQWGTPLGSGGRCTFCGFTYWKYFSRAQEKAVGLIGTSM